MQFSFAQEKTVTGIVSDKEGKIPGANVQVVGTKKVTTTDFDGKFSIKANVGDVIRVSYVAKNDLKVTVGVANSYNFKLNDAQILEEVVIGYGKVAKKKLVQAAKVVGPEALENLTVLSPQQMLQGQVAGVQVVQSSGVLGAATVVKIRGTASINGGGRPLYVIDGVPLADGLFTDGQGGQPLNPLIDINPNDIESQTVLKDAAAASIYGSRGSNGVILIVTKKGKKNQATRVVVEQTTSITKATDLLKMLDGDGYRKFLTLRGDNPALFLFDDFNWQKGVTRDGFGYNTNVGVSGGNEKTTYALNFSKDTRDGFIIGNTFNLLSGRVSLTHEVNDFIKVGANLSLSESKNDRVGSENSTFAPLTTAYLQAPWISPYDSAGNYVNLGFLANVVAIEKLDKNDSNTSRTYGNFYSEISFLKNFKFKTDFGVDRSTIDQYERSLQVNTPGTSGYGFNSVNFQNKYVITNTLNFDKKFFEKHNLNVLIGSTYEQTDVKQVAVEADTFASDLLLNVTSGANKTLTTSSTQNYRLNGYFSRLSYDYDNRYILEGSFRRDGSTRFASGKKYGNFWSIALGWNVINEDFLKDSKYISDFRIRGSVGTTGNDRVGDFAFIPLYAGGVGGAYNGAPGFFYNQPANNEYRWEQSKTTNLGLELGFLNDRIKLSTDVYVKKTTDLILSPPIPSTNGFVSVTGNVGSVENKGIELELTTVNFKSKNFSWKTSINISKNINKVLELPNANTDPDGNRFVSGGASQRAIEGYSINTFFLVRYVGVNPQTGNAEWLDRNGNITLTPTDNDRVIVGNANPEFAGGITNIFTFKGFDLNIFANYSVGNKILIDGLRFTDGLTSGFNKRVDVLDYWTTPGQDAYTPGLTSPTRAIFNRRSTAQLRDGSFLRINNVTLGYNLPKDMFNNSKFFKSARLYATLTNVYTFKSKRLQGFDPETTGTTNNLGQGETFFTPPQSKSYLLGARLTF